MSSSDNVFSSPTLSTFSGFKSSNVTVGVTAKCGDGPTRVYNIALVMQIVQPSKKELDCVREESKWIKTVEHTLLEQPKRFPHRFINQTQVCPIGPGIVKESCILQPRMRKVRRSNLTRQPQLVRYMINTWSTLFVETFRIAYLSWKLRYHTSTIFQVKVHETTYRWRFRASQVVEPLPKPTFTMTSYLS